jgi:hypothetical protein
MPPFDNTRKQEADMRDWARRLAATISLKHFVKNRVAPMP